MKGINTPVRFGGPGNHWNLWKCDITGSVSAVLLTQYIFVHEQKLLYTPLSMYFPPQILSHVAVMYHQHRAVVLGGPWPFPSDSRQGNPPARLPKLCLPHPACSGETQVTPHPSLSWWGRQHRNGLTNRQTHSLCLLQPPNPNFSREDQTQAPNSARTLQEWGVHRQLAAAEENCSSHWNANVRVRKENTRWHSYAIEKVHHELPNDKEFRFFPSFKNHV